MVCLNGCHRWDRNLSSVVVEVKMNGGNKNTTLSLCGGGLGRYGNSRLTKVIRAISEYGQLHLFFQKHVILYLFFT